ncbi:acyl-CoA-like ligand-binding transcription factor [Catenuloplanes indicus]|uniref:AcrR family transcriptional regulator n=1 Tax=Catenuloplanes indicus TaxID=137267 RepID=A0AAE3VVD6_9ACTN|nr:TetR family transcriptional regulator [Catenuloplanes indicus]MDQ0363700.1 AcrR family transcriptional regulator [Catenuloplanes indicus]
MGLREQKKQATRAALSWAAVRLIVERGAENVLVEDIAAAAGVSPRTFNNYFSSKGEAVAARHLDRHLQLAADLRARPAGEPLWTAITAAATAQTTPGPEVTAHPQHPDPAEWAAGIRAMMASPGLQAEMLRAGVRAEAEIAAAVAARTGTDPSRDLYPTLVAGAITAAHNAAQQQFVAHDASVSMTDLLREALSLLAAGLPEPAREP